MTTDWQVHYTRWKEYPDLEPELRRQLEQLEGDEKKREDCFYKPISFGTGGMRGVMGPGINRINMYTIRKATAGLALHLLEQETNLAALKVAIAYDSRAHSHTFALETAKVLGHYGITACLFEQLCPTPLLSFAVRHLGASAGVVITASHNPPEYNGYKIYGADGGQIPPEAAARIFAKIEQAGDELRIGTSEVTELMDSGLLHMIGDEVFAAYMTCQKQLRHPAAELALRTHQPRIIFSPLHGTTLAPITQGLQALGFTQVHVVSRQAEPDPLFPTVATPNPEEPESFRMALKQARKKGADLIICTDPDGDRLGVAVRTGPNQYVILNGNQTGVLLLDYILTQEKKAGTLPARAAVVKTVVTSEMVRAIASDYGVATIDTLTGFKYIGEKIHEFAQSGTHAFLFGLEESCGYLRGDFVRDKDAVQAAFLLADACACLLAQGSSLYQRLQELYAKYGHYREDLVSITYPGKDGMEAMTAILAALRSKPLASVAGRHVTSIDDYLHGKRWLAETNGTEPLSLPASDGLKYTLGERGWFCIRPSGTEPKMKLYFGVKNTSEAAALQALSDIKKAVLAYLQQLLPA
ncbi:phospho-sugar mutase [Brevibacillus gelatini]|uniref:Phosphoglucomutase n=1 Tax=Brevibacillus gelatini TaxID=1655277 RepID=A0A3M8AKM7_9BACL|nr:phospho-sugar mutase [Brevibacillus gelatini]RNB51741.1 phospho-sugar mutase [Brevibacillus gelatini]